MVQLKIIALFSCILLVGFGTQSCKKKKREALVGDYIGVERLVYYYDDGDTAQDELYEEIVSVTLSDKKTYKIIKTTHTEPFYIRANSVINDGKATDYSGFIPRRTLDVRFEGDSLHLHLFENHALYAWKKDYYFHGRK